MVVNDKVKMVLIAAVAVVGCMGLYLYFSPYHSCVRSLEESYGEAKANFACAKQLGGSGN